MKKKKPARRPVHRTVYETAHDHAANRLARAVEERTRYLLKLDELAREIPRLENIISATEPPESAQRPAVLPENRNPQAYTPPEVVAAAAAAKTMGMDQEEFLQKFMPRAGRVTSTAPPAVSRPQPDGTNPDPDEFLADDGPGRDILS